MTRIVDLSGGEPVPPGGKPIPGRTNLADVEWALTRARRFIFKGGDPALVEEYLNVWLDYRAELRGSPLEHVAKTQELRPVSSSPETE